MNLLPAPSSRFSRRVKRFGVSLMAALAAMALAACDAAVEPAKPASSIARGVQQILQTGGDAPLHVSQQPTGRPS